MEQQPIEATGQQPSEPQPEVHDHSDDITAVESNEQPQLPSEAAGKVADSPGKTEDCSLPEETNEQLSVEKLGDHVDDNMATAVEEANRSFSVDELTSRLRKSLTLEDPPSGGNKSFAEVDQDPEQPVEVLSGSESANISSEEIQQASDDSVTFFDCENTPFDQQAALPGK